MIGVGICGCGFMGRTHFQIFEDRPDTRVVALMDADERRRTGDWSEPLGNLPSRWPARVDMTGRGSYATVDDLLADAGVQLVVVTLPTRLHAAVSAAALRAGRHVLCEKPMALSFADCRAIIAAAEEARGAYMCGLCIRFWPQYVRIKVLADSGRFGKVRAVKLRRLASAPSYSNGGWLMDHTQSGGAVFDLHVHDVDFALHLLGPPETVFARGQTGPSGGIDHVESLWTYADDKVVSLEGGWCLPPGYPFEMSVQVRCEEATLQWPAPAPAGRRISCAGIRPTRRGESAPPRGAADRGPVMIHRADGTGEALPVAASNGWVEEIDYLVRCLAENRRPALLTPRDSAESIRLVELELASISSGRAVPVS